MRSQRLYEFGPFRLDTVEKVLLRDGEPVPLTPKAFDTLVALVERSGHLVKKDELMRAVWSDAFVEESNLTNNVYALRKMLGEGENGKSYIETVPKRGYRFTAPVKELPLETWLVEKRTVTRVVSEETVRDDAPPQPMIGSGESLVFEPARAHAQQSSKWRWLPVALLGLSLVIVGVFAYRSLTADHSLTAAPRPPIESIAVLPFKPLVTEGRDEVLEVGMADTLIAKLSNIGEVTVRPLSAVRRYGGLEQDPSEAGRKLGVEAVLDGTIQRSGERVRVAARLVSVSDGKQLWEGRFETPFTDIFSVQDAISEKVAASLKPRLTSAEERQLAKHYTDNVEAYQLYLRGTHHALKRTLPETQRAISYFQQAIDRDPSYALAYVGLADAHISSLAANLPPHEFLPQARAAAQKAVEIDDTLAAAHAQLGFVIFWWDRDWGASEKEFKRALELDPNSATAHVFYAHLLSNTGRHADAVAEAKRAIDLDPLNLRNNALEGQFLIHAGRTDEALARLRETLEMEPNYFLAHLYAASAYVEKGMYWEALGEARKAREISGGKSVYSEAFLGFALAKAGKEAEALSLLKDLLKSANEAYVSPYTIALIYNGLGKDDQALTWLERAYAQRAPGMVFLKVEPKWNNLRSEPRFQELLRRMGLA